MSAVRYFLSYRGVKLPLQLSSELVPDDIQNRNTFFEARYDDAGRLVAVDKKVYGDVEMTHRYTWDGDRLSLAVVQIGDDEAQVMTF